MKEIDADRVEDLRSVIELLFFAYRRFTGEADALLDGHGFGRAHHRVIYFVGRRPGVSVSELLAILDISKQSLGRVLRPLVDGGFVVAHADDADGRRRRLFLGERGQRLERALTIRQAILLDDAFARADAFGDARAADGFRAVLCQLAGTTPTAIQEEGC